MPDRTRRHVTKRPDGKWQVKEEGAERASAVTDTKEEAIDRGRQISKSDPNSQLIIHKGDGSFQEERTYGNDPFPPPG